VAGARPSSGKFGDSGRLNASISRPIAAQACPRRGDRIVVMGARDDSLSMFAHELLRRLAARE
jgi:hypothetical protein